MCVVSKAVRECRNHAGAADSSRIPIHGIRRRKTRRRINPTASAPKAVTSTDVARVMKTDLPKSR